MIHGYIVDVERVRILHPPRGCIGIAGMEHDRYVEFGGHLVDDAHTCVTRVKGLVPRIELEALDEARTEVVTDLAQVVVVVVQVADARHHAKVLPVFDGLHDLLRAGAVLVHFVRGKHQGIAHLVLGHGGDKAVQAFFQGGHAVLVVIVDVGVYVDDHGLLSGHRPW